MVALRTRLRQAGGARPRQLYPVALKEYNGKFAKRTGLLYSVSGSARRQGGSGELGGRVLGVAQDLADPLGRVEAMAARRPHRRDPPPAGPLGDGPLRHLEGAGDVAGA